MRHDFIQQTLVAMKTYRMFKYITLTILIIGTYSCTSSKQEYYIGFEKIGQISNDCELIHKNHLLLKGDSAFLFKEPYFVENKDTILSVSDGGFYYFKGKINKVKNHTSLSLDLTLINCDYCIQETLVDSITRHETFKHNIISYKIQTGEKLSLNNIEFEYQQSKQFPIDMVNFYGHNDIQIERVPEIELIAPKE